METGRAETKVGQNSLPLHQPRQALQEWEEARAHAHAKVEHAWGLNWGMRVDGT